MTTLQKTLVTATVAVLAGAGIYEAIQNSKLRKENKSQQQQVESQQQQIAQLKLESESLSNRLPVVADAKSLPDEQFKELLRLRGQVGVLRSQKTELESSLANVRNSQPRGPNPVTAQQPPPVLPADYPKTADGATKDMFESFARGDWDAFFAKFDMDGGRELFEKSITEGAKKTLLGMEVVSIGTPTNSFGPNMWLVPYTLRFKNGGEKTKLLHVAQDPKTQRWIMRGGGLGLQCRTTGVTILPCDLCLSRSLRTPSLRCRPRVCRWPISLAIRRSRLASVIVRAAISPCPRRATRPRPVSARRPRCARTVRGRCSQMRRPSSPTATPQHPRFTPVETAKRRLKPNSPAWRA